MSAALVVAGLFWFWTGVLILVGGFDLHLFGLTITSNDPTKPLWVALAASGLFAATASPDRRQRVLDALARAARPAIVMPVLVGWVAVVSLVYATNAPGGSDSYGYASQADLWLHGPLRVAQPWTTELPWPNAEWTASPLGYRPATEFGAGTIVPTYSPGLPLMMAGFKLVGGHCAMFLVVPLCAALMVACTYGIGHRLGLPTAGVIAAALVASSPTFLFFAMVPMSDMPVAGLWSLVFFGMLGTTRRSAWLTGLACAAALLVRPNLAFLAAIVALRYLIVEGATAGAPWRHGLGRLLAFGAGLAPAFIVIPMLYNHLYGSPFRSGYGSLDGLFAWSNVRANLPRYLSWFTDTQTAWPFMGALAMLIPAARLWPGVRDRRLVLLLGVCCLALWLHYFVYLVFEDWQYLRFVLPSWPLLMLGLAAVIALLLRRTGAWAPVLGAAATILLCIHTLEIARSRGAFESWRREREIIAISRLIAAETPAPSVFLTMQHSGSLRYYAGRLTLRYDQLDVAWLDRAVEWLQARGITSYALLDDWEVPEFRRRFPGQAVTRQLETPLWEFRGQRTAYVYDLSRNPAAPPKPVDRTDIFSRMHRCDPGVPLTVPSFARR